MKGLSVLLAEGHVTHRKHILQLIERAGHAGTAVATGPAALAAAAAADVVLLNVRLPELDGLEVARRLREARSPQTGPLIIGYATTPLPAYPDRCAAAGMDAFLAQPLRWTDLDELLNALAAIGARRRPA